MVLYGNSFIQLIITRFENQTVLVNKFLWQITTVQEVI